jgi:hypothetical protein
MRAGTDIFDRLPEKLRKRADAYTVGIHSRMVLSLDPDAMTSPLGEKATENTDA